MELKGFFHEKDGDECGLDVGYDPEHSEDSTGELKREIEMDMDMDDETLVDGNIDKILDWVEYLPAVERLGKESESSLDGDRDDVEGGLGKVEAQEKETYFHEFHTMIERLRVHDLGDRQSLNPIVWPQKRMLGDTEPSSGLGMVMKKAMMERVNGEIGTAMSSTKKRGWTVEEDDRGSGDCGEREGRKSVKRARSNVCAGASVG